MNLYKASRAGFGVARKISISTVRGLMVICVVFASTLAAGAAYHVIKRVSIPGDEGWDYITADTEGRRLYVPHGVEVVVLDLDSGVIVGKIVGLKDAHGVAIAREFGRGFVDATDPGSVAIFDLKSLATIDRIRVGDDPNGIIYDPQTKRVFTADRGSKRLTAIDAKSGKVVAQADNLGGRTEHLAADQAGHVFLNMQDRNTLLKIDAQTLKILETWPTAPCEQPSSMDMDRKHGRIIIGCRGEGMMAVVDATSGKIVATNPIGAGVDAVEYDSQSELAYFSTGGGSGILSIFHEDTLDKYALVENVKTLPGARTMALDRKTGKVYLPVADLAPAPAPTTDNPRPRASRVTGTFSVMVVGP
jgi:DNA-binding beta-propeller fold protein YncE